MKGRTLSSLKTRGYDITASANAYWPVEAQIANAVSDDAVNFGSLETVTSCEINNDNASDDLTVKLNGNSTGFTVKGGESKTINQTLITSMSLSNTSGNPIDYRIHLWGFDNV